MQKTMQPHSRLVLLIACLAVIGGCTTQVPKPEPVEWTTHQQQVSQLQQWQLKGKMGYRQSGDGGSAWIDWQQHINSFDMRLSGPFGAGTTHIHSNQQLTRLEQSGEQPIAANTATELTEYLFGWQWPVEDLHYWVRGIPSPLSPIGGQSRNESQLLASLEQSGWRLEFSRYRTEGNWTLPGKIRGHLLSDNGDTSFTLVIKSWQPLLPTPEQSAEQQK